jgi:outer membrane protein assembly factor BamB
MRKNLARILPLISLLVMVLGLNACTWFSSGTSGTTAHPDDVLVTQQDAVTLLSKQTGKQIWQYRTQMDHFLPLISDSMLYIVSKEASGYISTRGTLQALDIKSGQPVWSWIWKEDGTLANAPTIADGIIYLSESVIRTVPVNAAPTPDDYQGFVVALRASDGRQLWKLSLPGQFSPPTVANGTVYVNSGLAVLALRGSDGHQIWQYQPGASENFDYYTSMGPQEREANVMVAQGDKLYVYLQHIEGNGWVHDLVALNSHTGQVDWMYPGHGILGPFILKDNVIYLTSYVSPGNPFVAALNASSGSVLWTYKEPLATIQSQLTLAGNLLYEREATASPLTSDIVALSTTDGSVQHRYTPPGGEVFVGSPVVDQHVLYIDVVLPGTSQEQHSLGIIALDTTGGAETWHSPPLQPFAGITILISQGQVYAFSSWDYTPDTLVVFQASDGQQSWRYPTTGYIYHVIPYF